MFRVIPRSTGEGLEPAMTGQRRWGCLLWLLTAGVFADANDAGLPPAEIRDRRELFVDSHLIERLQGTARLRRHEPVPQGVVLVHDAPWEGNATAYHSVFRDGDLYRMFYRAGSIAVRDGQIQPGPETLCYAESPDGIHWQKPVVGLHEFQGQRDNNIVLTRAQVDQWGATIGGPAVFLDQNPRIPAAERYKLILTGKRPLGMLPAGAADPLRWTVLSDSAVITRGAFDAQNLAFWDAERGEYRAYWRYFTGGATTADEWKPAGFRRIRTASSPDLLIWSEPQDLIISGGESEHLYENGIHPYDRAPHLLIGFPVRYIDRGLGGMTDGDDGNRPLTAKQARDWSPSLRALPEFQQRVARAAGGERLGSALTETLFMVSRDGVRFHRWAEAFLRPGPERPGTWNYGQQFVAWRPVETPSELPGGAPELSFFATEGYWTAAGTSLRRYTLRLDGFVSLCAGANLGELQTRPLIFAGNRLSLNFSTSAAGVVRVELQDIGGKPIAGFSRHDCDELFGDTIDRSVTWRGSADVAAVAGRPVRLLFELRDADVYSYRFQR